MPQRTLHRENRRIVGIHADFDVRLHKALAGQCAEKLLQPANAVRHPIRYSAADTVGVDPFLGGGKAVAAVGIGVAFKGNAMFCQRQLHHQAVFDVHRAVIPGSHQKAGAGIGGNMFVGLGHPRLAKVADVFQDSRIHQNGCGGLVLGHGGSAGAQVTACRKAHRRNTGFVQMPLVGVFLDQSHGLLIVVQRVGPRLVCARGIPQNKRLIPGFQIGCRHWVGLPVGTHGVSAARQNQNCRALVKAKLTIYFLQIGGQRDMAGFVENQQLFFHRMTSSYFPSRHASAIIRAAQRSKSARVTL